MSQHAIATDVAAGRTLLGIPLNQLPIAALVARAVRAIDEPAEAPFTFACANPHSLVVARRDAYFRQCLRSCSALVADGIGVQVAGLISGGQFGPRITGWDFFHATMGELDRRGGKAFFFGSRAEVLELLRKRAAGDYPGVRIETLSPPYGDWTEAENEAMLERIRGGDNHHYPHPDTSSRDFIDPRTLSKAVDAILPADRVVASDSGHFCGWVPRYLRVPNARASCLSHSFQSVGLGLPSVIGLAVANPGKLAVLGTGDGGFLMSMADLETAMRLKLRLAILVYNDSSYAAEVHYFRRQGYSVDIAQFPETDFAAIARGFGARSVTVRTLADLDPLKAWVLSLIHI